MRQFDVVLPFQAGMLSLGNVAPFGQVSTVGQVSSVGQVVTVSQVSTVGQVVTMGQVSTVGQYPSAPAAPRTVSKPVDLSWLFKAMTCGRDECSKEVLTGLISGLSDLLLSRAYDVVDLILRSIATSQLSPEVLLAIARTSFAARHNLLEWAGYVGAMKDEFRHRGLDANRLAQGLS
jgi:hypothetical protein